MNFVDIHTHIIPGIDDGPKTIDEVLEMVRIAYNGGTRQMIATPHMFLDPYNNMDLLKINDSFARTIFKLRESSESPQFGFLKEMMFYLGSENYVSLEFLEALDKHCVVTLNGSRYLLIEFPPFLIPEKLIIVLNRIFQIGLVPVIAHAERNLSVQEKPELIRRFFEMGCVVQINADSILGAAGSRVRKTSTSLLIKGFVHVIASDGHRASVRPPQLKGAFCVLQQKFPEEKLLTWMAENPKLILRNKSLLQLESDVQD